MQSQGMVTFNGTVASPTSRTDYAITVADPGGATDGYVVVTVAGVSSNGVWFAQPKITGTSPGSAAVGATVTINGSHFGTSTGSVQFNGIAATPSSWGAGSVVRFRFPTHCRAHQLRGRAAKAESICSTNALLNKFSIS